MASSSLSYNTDRISDVLSEVLVLPKPKEKPKSRRKGGLTLCQPLRSSLTPKFKKKFIFYKKNVYGITLHNIALLIVVARVEKNGLWKWKASLDQAVELITQFVEDEEMPESSDEWDMNVRCDYVDDDGEELILPTVPVSYGQSDAV